MSEVLQTRDLPASLRALRVGLDDDVHIRRTIHLAAAKIEDLQEQVARLVSDLNSRKPGDGSPTMREVFGRRTG